MNFIRRWWLVAVLLGVPMAVLVILRATPAVDKRWFSPDGHLVVVGGIAACALVVAIVAILAARRVPQPGVVWLGLGCASVGLLMLAHGLTTPGALGQPPNRWVGRLPYFAMTVFAVCLFVSGRRPDRGFNRWVARHPLLTVTVPMSLAGLAVVAIVNDPTRFHGTSSPAWENEVTLAVSTLVVICLAAVTWRHARRWHLGHDLMQLAIVLAASMSIAAVFAFEHGRQGRLSWWDYHAYLLGGFGAAVFAILLRGKRQKTITDVMATTFVDDPFRHIEAGYPEALSSLVKAVEIKDAYTHGHSQRTAQLAVELGVQLGLPPDRLRIIARGAYLHDLGKIAIPDHILNKPGALTPDERAVIETHPQLGFELASQAPSLREVLPIILHHHERIDGGGYPAGLAGNAMPLEARVVAVADVWDALTSDRAYRRGWDPVRALSHIKAGAGTHFDPVIVDALVELKAEAGIRLDPIPGVAEEAWTAAQTCHEIGAVPQLTNA